MLDITARMHIMLVRITNSLDPDQTASGTALFALGLYGRQLVFGILEHKFTVSLKQPTTCI